jgi:hypothetical protein
MPVFIMALTCTRSGLSVPCSFTRRCKSFHHWLLDEDTLQSLQFSKCLGKLPPANCSSLPCGSSHTHWGETAATSKHAADLL